MARTTRRRAATSPNGNGAGEAAATPRAPRENLPRPAPAPVAAGITRPSPDQKHRRNPFGFLHRLTPRYVTDVLAELRKVTWPSFEETRYLTVVVAIVAASVGIVLGSIDLFFGWAIEKLFF
jgi:preprotein translocase SecE subunit